MIKTPTQYSFHPCFYLQTLLFELFKNQSKFLYEYCNDRISTLQIPTTVLVSQIIVNMMSEQSRHKIYVCQYQKFWSSYLATLTNNYITVWRVSKKAEGIDVALIKGGCSLLTLSFFNTQQFNIVKPKKNHYLQFILFHI